MTRRLFLQTLGAAGGTLLASCGSSASSAGHAIAGPPAHDEGYRRRVPVRGICFDLFTLFNPRTVDEVARELVGDEAEALCAAWRRRQFEYSWLRAVAERYRDFEAITREALTFATTERGVTLTDSQANRLVETYSRLEPWPDAEQALRRFREAGLRLAPLANFSPRMLDGLVSHSGFRVHFDDLISTDVARTFKPSPRAYELGERRLGLRREEIVFAAFGGWDAAGAKWFGFRSFWVNRFDVAPEALDALPDGSGPGLAELAAFIAGMSAEES